MGSLWLSPLSGFRLGNVLDFSTISARLVLTPLGGFTGDSGARTGFVTVAVGGGTTLPEMERPLTPNGTGGLRIPGMFNQSVSNGGQLSENGCGKDNFGNIESVTVLNNRLFQKID